MINAISRVLQKSLMYFNVTSIPVLFELPHFSVAFTLDLNGLEAVVAALTASPGSSLKYCFKSLDVFK